MEVTSYLRFFFHLTSEHRLDQKLSEIPKNEILIFFNCTKGLVFAYIHFTG